MDNEPTTIARFERRRPPLWSPTFRTVIGANVLVAALAMWSVSKSPAHLIWWGGILGFTTVIIWISVRSRRMQLAVPFEPLVIESEHISIPRGPEAPQTDRIPLRDIVGVDLRRRGKRRFLFLMTERRFYIMPEDMFAQPNVFEPLMLLIRERIAASPGAQRLLERMAAEEQRVRQIFARKPGITSALLLTMVIGFMLQSRLGALLSPIEMMRFGANVPILVAEGQMYRLVSATFLHANVIHLFFNGLALWFLGRWAERIMGGARFFVAFMLAAVGGSLLSAWMTQGIMSLGASTGVFGLFAAVGVLQWRLGNQLPLGVRISKRAWWMFLGLNVFITLAVPQIDAAAHFGGFFVGAAVTYNFVHAANLKLLLRPASIPIRVGAGAVFAVTVVALWQAVAVYQSSKDDPRYRKIIAKHYDDVRAPPVELNVLAWSTAIDPDATKEELTKALTMADRAVDREPRRHEFIDTKSTLLYRLGQLQDAVETQRKAIRLRPDPVYMTQLARFLLAMSPEDRPIPEGASWEASPVGEAWSCTLRLPEGFAGQGMTAYVVMENGAGVVGVIDISAVPATSTVTFRASEFPLGQDAPTRSTLLLLDSPKRDRTSGKLWRWVPAHPEVLKYP